MDDAGVQRHPSDLVMNNPIRIDALNRGDVVLLPLIGEVRVIRTPFFDPAHNREFITLVLANDERQYTLICTRNMCFQHVRYVLGL